MNLFHLIYSHNVVLNLTVHKFKIWIFLLIRLTAVFIHAQGEVKRSIIKLLTQPIQNMSMNSPEMFRLLEDLPKGAEAMIVRVLHIVTEKGNSFVFI